MNYKYYKINLKIKQSNKNNNIIQNNNLNQIYKMLIAYKIFLKLIITSKTNTEYIFKICLKIK